MQIAQGLEGLTSTPSASSAPPVVSIGNFDGLHLGHRKILQTCEDLRRSSAGAQIVVVTFEPHPLTVLRPEKAPPRLTPPSLKRELLEQAGVDRLVILPPTRDVLNLSAENFWAILKD